MSDEPPVQLNVWIPKDLRDYVEERKRRDNKPGMNIVIAELIRQERAREQGEVIEQQALPVLQEMIRKEVRQALAEHRRDVRDERDQEHEEQQASLQKGFDRIAALTVNAIRNAGIGRRLSYSLLAKAYGSTFALDAFNDAKEKARQELLPRKGEQEQ